MLIVGTEALADEIRHVGLRPVRSFEDAPAAVVQGHSPTTDWAILAEATLAIRAGAVWVAANLDTTLPTERGLVLGNGSMVAALRTATSREPLVAGKPAAPLMEDAMRRSKCVRPLVVGDRLDTDIEGANNVGLDSLLVLTGVSTAVDVLRAAPPEQRPTYLASELDALNRPAEESLIGEDNRWSVEFDGSDLVIEPTSESAAPVDSAALLRAVTAGAWKFPRLLADHVDDAHGECGRLRLGCLKPGRPALSVTRFAVCVSERDGLALCPMSTPIPRPGAHLPGPPQSVDPETIHTEVDGLLLRLGAVEPDPDDEHGVGVIPRKAHLLEKAHDVLVEALATVDKI